MNLDKFRQLVESIPYGKRLPTALYVYRDEKASFGEDLDRLLSRLIVDHGADGGFNIVKFRLDELKLSVLSYPDFVERPHPSLRRAITIDLARGKVRQADYSNHSNPPILHRKEAFLPPNHPKRELFARLTLAEETAGLFANTETIGFRLNWERLLVDKGFFIRGHDLYRVKAIEEKEAAPMPVIQRHKTALARYELSKPVKTLLEYGQLRAGTTLFDYGCGHGADVEGLRNLGYSATGWDPVHRPSDPKSEADVVNLGYVVNVIEDPAERLETIVDAFHQARRLLVVSALINETVDMATAKHYGDGVLTRSNTFQKFFEQQELQQYIEDALDTTAVPVSLGIFYVFRDPVEQQDFIEARTRRTIDWTQISARLGLAGPKVLWKTLYEDHKELLGAFGKVALALGRIPGPNEFGRVAEVSERLGSAKRALRAYVQGGGAEGVDWEEVRVRFGIGQPLKRRWELLYEEHRKLLDSFWSLALQLGRLPEAEEFPRSTELRDKIGTPKQALRIFIQKGGAEEMRRAKENRLQGLLVYVALANLRKRVPFGHLSKSLRSDIRAFFGNYTRALEKGLELLYSAGDPGEIELACENLKLGWQDEQALYLHWSLLEQLPPVLRAYVGCAVALFGDVQQADVIKLHKVSGKVTFLAYDDFENKPLPELRARIKVNLRTRWVQVFDHSAEGQLLYFKERLLTGDHSRLSEMQAFSAKLRKTGIPALESGGPSRVELLRLLGERGLNGNLNRRRKLL